MGDGRVPDRSGFGGGGTRRIWRESPVKESKSSVWGGAVGVLCAVLTQSKGELYLQRHSGNLSLWP